MIVLTYNTFSSELFNCYIKDHISLLISATHQRSVMLNLFQHLLEF